MEQAIVVQNQDRIGSLPNEVQALQGPLHPLAPLNVEWCGDDCDDESAGPLGLLCNDGGDTGPGSSSQSRCDEDQVRSVNDLGDHVPAGLCASPAHDWIPSCTETPCDVSSDQ